MSTWLFFFIGIFVGALGTLIGAGGGFLLVPLMLFMFPQFASTKVTAISMLAVAANSISGSIAYYFKKQIHWNSALLFSAASVPGIWIGLSLAEVVERDSFELTFGLLLALVSCFLFYRTLVVKRRDDDHEYKLTTKAAVLGCFISIFVGVLSSFLGIGGGVIHVPMMAEFIHFPVHIATGTSHVILAFTSTLTVFGHWRAGHYAENPEFVPYLIVGVVLGAQIGARYSKRVASQRILQVLAVVLLLLAMRLILS